MPKELKMYSLDCRRNFLLPDRMMYCLESAEASSQEEGPETKPTAFSTRNR